MAAPLRLTGPTIDRWPLNTRRATVERDDDYLCRLPPASTSDPGSAGAG